MNKNRFELLYDENVTKKDYDKICEEVTERFYEICEIIYQYEHKDKNRDYINFSNAADSDYGFYDGYFDPEIYQNFIDIRTYHKSNYLGFNNSFPVCWLWYTNEQIEEELLKNHNIEFEKFKEKEEKRKSQEEIFEKLKNSILNKLSDEEKKIICFVREKYLEPRILP